MAFAALPACALLILSPASLALTTPEPGAVAWPGDLELQLPFLAGEECAVSSGYGPSGGSRYHINTESTVQPNDYYALDFVLPLHPDNGLAQPVVAAFGGTVVKAGWSEGSMFSYGRRIIVRREHSDGHAYTALYAHLNAISVVEGQIVEVGEPLGELGDSCAYDERLAMCPGWPPHLHWSVHRDSLIGGEGDGAYGGNAAVPEPMDGYQDIQPGQTVFAGGEPAPQECPELPPQASTVYDDGPCFHRRGPAHAWGSVAHGGDAHSFFTYTIDADTADNWGEWELRFVQAGDYELQVYIPAEVSDAQQAVYVVSHGDQQTRVPVDQSSVEDDWVSLGVFGFAAGKQEVQLADNTGEPFTRTNPIAIAFDDLRVLPQFVAEDAGMAEEDAGSDAEDAGLGAKDAAGLDAFDAGSGPDNAGLFHTLPVADSNDETTASSLGNGFSCTQSGPPQGVTALLLLALLALRARRQRV